MANISTPPVFHEQNLSYAWGHMLLDLLATPGGEKGPITVCIDGFDENDDVSEDQDIRNALDVLLAGKEQNSIDNVAFTIFPQRIWQIAKGNREALYSFYRYSFASFRKKQVNRCGLYFQRMTMTDPDDEKNSHNQLEYIINRHIKQHEQGRGAPRMHLTASVHDPIRDHTNVPVPGFPCMQQVSFCPTNDGLVVNATYATQQAVRKAYGNFLGLAHLAKFMAGEMGLKLAQLNIMIGVEKIGDHRFPKSSLQNIKELIEQKVVNGT